MNEDQKKPGLKRLDLNSPMFEANGKKYYIESSLSIERYCEFQILEKELAFGMTFEAMVKKLTELYKILNRQELVNAAVLLNDMVKGIAKVKDRELAVLKVCALFINEENEDRASWSADLAVKKIDDWKKEGIDVADFFAVALNSVNGFLQAYNKISQAISGITAIQALSNEEAKKN